MNNEKFSILKRIKSFRYALNGLWILIKEEHNSRIHLVAMIGVIILGFIFELSALVWIGILLSIGMVITLELVNSAIENLSDFVTADKHDLIKKTKDLAAAGVLFASIIALTVGLIIFLPKIF